MGGSTAERPVTSPTMVAVLSATLPFTKNLKSS